MRTICNVVNKTICKQMFKEYQVVLLHTYLPIRYPCVYHLKAHVCSTFKTPLPDSKQHVLNKTCDI